MNKLRRENIILDPVLDRLSLITEYKELSLFKVEEYDHKLIVYRGNIPQSEALSINISLESMDKERIQFYNRLLSSESKSDENGNIRFTHVKASAVFIPILKEDGKVVAGAYLEHSEPDHFTVELAKKIQDFFVSEIRVIEAGMLLAEAMQLNAGLDSLFDIQGLLNKEMDQTRILDIVVNKAKALVFARNAYVFLNDEDGYILSAMKQTDLGDIHVGDRFRFSSIYPDYPKSRVEKPDVQQSVMSERLTHIMEQNNSLVVEIKSQDQPLGFIMVVDKLLGDFGGADYRFLSMLASITGPILQNAILYNCARNVAALEERDRLSRELHDDLAQRMAYFKVETGFIKRLLSEKNYEAIEDHRKQLDLAIDESFNNLREIIFNLREELLPDTRFLDSLSRYLYEYKRHYGLDVKFTNLVHQMPRLNQDDVAQISRIIQEGLMNVRKHASTNRAEILLRNEDRRLILQIRDDGKGFLMRDVENDTQAHFGTTIMQERAESIGGKLTIESTPSKGTMITMSLPLDREYEDE